MVAVTKPTPKVEVVSAEALVAKHGNKSRAIRALAAEGHTKSEISKMLGIRYQFVRNVLAIPVKQLMQ